ncbi:MAG TPA: efflux RND transporter periplasmic adaptor subunit [Phycisphaerae bacterium]|jgi:Cu(I)/Ag(I) efflux system membrane fusion protein/cobalt-zinc-cadmium efflux system membrane fusion protein|nr:efflux RND transporter periplasmic adaptor subunit [Phycisphaerae bacterium]HOB74481.1 efflux RND transporter periplasmic adaptor subunit [Phycisphaerae bacterium]HOJ54309.1 efflux RND transporter periplasmic adaptor subunit [Phycisphaerae bacterium]HOL26780.1 efflux RND transporter periplasmic adaptor subunit [Phycisphaerae bacterium]HPP20666.1 efflux RND transporter periplasmic adaptor subunit [Phycisphaerae bacterium]
MTPYCRKGYTWLVALFTLLGLAGGMALGVWYARRQPGPAVGAAAGEGEQLYTCGMHPQVIQKGPGICPICNMQLTPLKAGGESDSTASLERRVLYWRSPMNPNEVSDQPGQDSMGMELVPVYSAEGESPGGHTVRIDPITVQNMGIRTAPVKRGRLTKTIRTVGRVAYSEELVTYVNTKFDGWIEKLYVNQTGQHVEKGAPLFDIYSPKLYLAQEEFLSAVRGARAMSSTNSSWNIDDGLVAASRTRLRLLDISDDQIDAIAASGRPRRSLTIYSPAGGIVTEKEALVGKYVETGAKLYTVADLSKVWVYVSVYEYQLPWVRMGQTATMSLPYTPGKEYHGRVVYIYPYLEEQTRVVRVRLEFDNPGLDLKPDMYATVTLRSELDREALLIPREAYIDSGVRKVAFVDAGEGKFQPREIHVGVEAEEGLVEVLYGLDEGDHVVTSGQFLLDSESKLQEAVAKMRAPTAPPG